MFTGNDAVLPSGAITDKYVTDFDTLTTMGNELLADLVSQLGLE